ncbi:MAG: DeoR/GlpR transcriptional regulator [Clostridia bacterium]|nr:DeoR/GlpR transcriptional regulator [Clostridia bacterium]
MDASRREQVREILLSKPFTSLTELEERFPDVSSMTLRRDIAFCEAKGEVIKVRGGARAMRFLTLSLEKAASVRASENISEKERIAEAAVGFIETGRSLFFDSGSTVMRMVHHLPDERLTISTSDPNIALSLSNDEKININIIGGNLNHSNLSLSGAPALDFVSNTNLDVAFLSPSGFSLECGFTSGNYNESELKKAVVRKARFVVMLVQSSKIGKSMPYTFASLSEADVLITDARPSAELYKACVEADVRLIVREKE